MRYISKKEIQRIREMPVDPANPFERIRLIMKWGMQELKKNRRNIIKVQTGIGKISTVPIGQPAPINNINVGAMSKDLGIIPSEFETDYDKKDYDN